MLDQDFYIKKQENLLAAFKLADEINKRAIAEQMFHLHKLKENPFEEYKQEVINLPEQDLKFHPNPFKDGLSKNTEKSQTSFTITTPLANENNIEKDGLVTYSNGKKFDLNALFQQHPGLAKKFAEAINHGRELLIREDAKKNGMVVEKQIIGDKVQFKLKVDPNSELDDINKHVQVIEDDLVSMKKKDETLTTKPMMTALPDSSPNATQDMRTTVTNNRSEGTNQGSENPNDNDNKHGLL